MSPTLQGLNIQTPDPQDELVKESGAEDPAKLIRTLPDDALVIIPVRNMVLFPGMIVPISIGRESSIAAAQYAVKAERPIGILMQLDAEMEAPGADDLATVGTIAPILRYVTTPDGSHHLICQGQQRFRVMQYVEGFPFIVARIERITETVVQTDSEIEARYLRLKERAIEVLQLLPQVPKEMIHAVKGIDTPGMLADLVAGYMDIKANEKQEVLEEVDLRKRLDLILDKVNHRIEVLEISRDIDKRTKENLGQREREFLLREQMKAIQKELGEDGGGNAEEMSELRALIAESGMPEDVAAQASKELKRLERMSDGSAEYAMVRTYLDWLVELPWKAPDHDAIDMAQARQILDTDHFGLDQVKKRILKFLAVRKLKPGGHGPILCLVGPPGVGKTSLGQSIARAMGRKFVRVSLGGVHDEAEIRSHRRTYIGALPGNIIQALKKAGTRGCVMMLDEIDKLGAGAHGDPSAALLEVLDPEQNHTFRDNYLAVPFDLSQVLFIEASRTPGTGRLILTGQLGEVMKESAQAALTLVKSRANAFKIDASLFEKSDVHIHVPAGAIPKDGPSAGVAMFIALTSLFLNRAVHNDVAMTGEISLRGLVLPVGGIKEKVLAALAAGVKKVMLPARNRRDLDDVPAQARAQLEFLFLDDVETAIPIAIEPEHREPTNG